MRPGAEFELIRGRTMDGRAVTIAPPAGGWKAGRVYEVEITDGDGRSLVTQAVEWDGQPHRGRIRVKWNPPADG